MERCNGRRLYSICCSLSLSRLSVAIAIIASAVHLLQMTLSLPVIKSSRVDTSGAVRTSYETTTRDRPRRYVSHHYQTLVSSLEAVGVLDDANQSDCFVLENLTKDWRPGVDGVSMIEVTLQLRRFQVPMGVKGRGRERGGQRKPKWSDDNSAVTETHNACLEWLTRTTTVSSTQTTTTKVTPADQWNGLNDETSLGSAATLRNKSNSEAPVETKAKANPKQEEHSGLNKRQILVISTCSTVIGAFFVTAFILRIRNYMKRSKQDKDGTKRHVRAASMPHQRTHHGSLDHFANNENHRRWSHFNPFATDR